MTAYVVYQGHVTDPAAYEEYRAAAGPSVVAAGGRFVARGGASQTLEGATPPQRTVLIEFETMAAARAWYDSERYKAAKALRAHAADVASMYIIDGA